MKQIDDGILHINAIETYFQVMVTYGTVEVWFKTPANAIAWVKNQIDLKQPHRFTIDFDLQKLSKDNDHA